jgi:hypothetical protein
MRGIKKIWGRPSVPDPDAPRRGSSARPPKLVSRASGRRQECFRVRAPLSFVSTRNPVASLRWPGIAGGANRATSPIAGTRDTAISLSHAIMRAMAAAPYRVLGARRRTLTLRCDASIESTLFAAKGFPRSLTYPSAAAFDFARKLSPRCLLGRARSCALSTISGRA